MKLLLSLSLVAMCLSAQNPEAEFFEKKIRPVFATKCYPCHSSQSKTPMGNLILDTKAGTAKVITAGDPSHSKLLEAIKYTNSRLQMPPSGKLPDSVLADFETWIRNGAFDPRQDAASPVSSSPGALPIDKGRKWWAFQPLNPQTPPQVRLTSWPKSKIDYFVLNKLEQNRITPSQPADPRSLVRRLYLDLTGIAPTYDQVEAFVNDPSDAAYKELVESLLKSQHYGERWGRYWLDVARFAEDNPTSEATNPPYPLAWRYRDWVIEAVNKDLPFDRFVKLQLAADLIPDTPRDDFRALGYLGAAPVYHKDARLSKEVIETLATDDWDERVDAVSRGILGLTVACARCHDHKFDPILTKDYYALAGVFASSSQVLRPLRDMDPAVETRFLFIQQRLIHLDYLAKLLTGEPGTKPEESKKKVVLYRAEIEKLKAELQSFNQPDLTELLARYGTERTRNRAAEAAPNVSQFTPAVYEAGIWIDGSDPDITYMDYRPAQPRELPVFLRGSVATPGEQAPRKFLTVLNPENRVFTEGSGRRELADSIFDKGGTLAARVFVNRVWAWHFGKPLVPTTSDFGTQGEKPTHPELLEDLAARFIANGWSMKWLHREILFSSTYRQSSHPRADGELKDATNRLLWRMNPRRLDIEAFRDSILESTAKLDEKMFGPSAELDLATNLRRTVYAKISRGRLNTIFRLYDFSDPSQHSPGRELTTTPLQQLFVMNSPFFEDQAEALSKRVENEAENSAKVRALYRYALARDPKPQEIDLSLSFLNQGTVPQLAQAILATNEFIFWP